MTDATGYGLGAAIVINGVALPPEEKFIGDLSTR